MVTITSLNGRMPTSRLSTVDGVGHRLQTATAIAFLRMSSAMEQAGLGRLTLSPGLSAYRTLEDQRTMIRKGLSTMPAGKSQHGEGLAADIDNLGGFNGARYKWLEENGPRFGFKQPTWARKKGSLPEPWHWEHDGVTLGSPPPAPKPNPVPTPKPDPLTPPAPLPMPAHLNLLEDDMIERALIAAFRKFLGRMPSQGELDERIIAVVSTANVEKALAAQVEEISRALEARRWLISSIYMELLGRPASDAEADNRLRALDAGKSLEVQRAEVAASQEARDYAAKKATK